MPPRPGLTRPLPGPPGEGGPLLRSLREPRPSDTPQNIENNPMHSSGMTHPSVPRIHLTRRANHCHDGNLTQFARRISPGQVTLTTLALHWRRAIAGWRRGWAAHHVDPVCEIRVLRA